MHLEELRLRGFRNYASADIRPIHGINIFVGENAQGKSNLLEAIYLLAVTKSLRAGRDSEMVLQGEEFATVSASVAREREGEVELDLAILRTDKKSVRVNGVKKIRVIDLLGEMNAVFFGSLDLGIVSGEPSVRRRFMNLEISQISPKYVFDLAAYKKALEQRNRLLRDLRDRPYRDSGLEAWDEQLVHYGSPVIEKRRFFVERLRPLADEIHAELTDGRERLEVRYQPSVPLPSAEEAGEIADAFRAEIDRVKPDELRRGLTLLGPQRDDLQLLINGMDARTYGSQGQQRTVVLSLKLAEFRLMQEYVGEPPVVLLDDVMSDLDDARRRHLLQWVRRRCQTFITCTNLNAFEEEVLEEAKVFDVVEGRVESRESRVESAGA